MNFIEYGTTKAPSAAAATGVMAAPGQSVLLSVWMVLDVGDDLDRDILGLIQVVDYEAKLSSPRENPEEEEVNGG